MIVGGTISYHQIYSAQGNIQAAALLSYLSYINLGLFFGILMICETIHYLKNKRSTIEYVAKSCPVMTFPEFCRRVYDGE